MEERPRAILPRFLYNYVHALRSPDKYALRKSRFTQSKNIKVWSNLIFGVEFKAETDLWHSSFYILTSGTHDLLNSCIVRISTQTTSEQL